MKATTVMEMDCACEDCRKGSQGCLAYPSGKIPAGTTREDPDAWRLVRMGVAIPADKECKKAANMTDQKMTAAQHAARRTAAGIHPEDYEKFDAGIMVGYYSDGSDRPGPNADHISEGGILLDDYDEDCDV